MTENSVGRQFWGRSWVEEDAKEAIRPSNVREALSQYYRARSPQADAAAPSLPSEAARPLESVRPYSPFTTIGSQFSSLARSIDETRDAFRSVGHPSLDSAVAAPSTSQLLRNSQSANVLEREPLLDARSDQRDSQSSVSLLLQDARLQDALRGTASLSEVEPASLAGMPPKHLSFLHRNSAVEAVTRGHDLSPQLNTGSRNQPQDFSERHASPQFREPSGPQSSLRTHAPGVSATPQGSIGSSVGTTPWLTTEFPRAHAPALPSTHMSDASIAKPSLRHSDDSYLPSAQSHRFSDRDPVHGYPPSHTGTRALSHRDNTDSRSSHNPIHSTRRFPNNYPQETPIVYPTRRKRTSSRTSSSSERGLRSSHMSQVQQKIFRYMKKRGITSSSSSSTSSSTSRELSPDARRISATAAVTSRKNRAKKQSPSKETVDRLSGAKEKKKTKEKTSGGTWTPERAEKKPDKTLESSRNDAIKNVSVAWTDSSHETKKPEAASVDAPRRQSYVEMKKNMQTQRANDTKLSDIEARVAFLEAENKKHAERLQLTDDRLAAADAKQQAWKRELEERIETRCTDVEEGIASRLSRVEETWAAKVKELEARVNVEGMTERKVRSIIQQEIVEAKHLLQQKWKQELEAMQEPVHRSPAKSYIGPDDHLIYEPEMEQGTDADSIEGPFPATASVWKNPTSPELADSVVRVQSIAKAARRVSADLGHMKSVETWDKEWDAERQRLQGIQAWAQDILNEHVEAGTLTSSDDDAPHVRVNMSKSSSSKDSNYHKALHAARDNRNASSFQYSTSDFSRTSLISGRMRPSAQFSAYDASGRAQGNHRTRSFSQSFAPASDVPPSPEHHRAGARTLISRRSETRKRGSIRRKRKTESHDIVF